MKSKITLNINSDKVTVEANPDTPLLYVLRNDLEFNGPKFGCGMAQCGACMVLLDNEAIPSCQLPVSEVKDREITTLEGLADESGKLHKVQQSFLDEQAAQCGYCLNGMVMAAVSLLNKIPDPSEEDIRSGLNRNICRCGVHSRVMKAIQKASKA